MGKGTLKKFVVDQTGVTLAEAGKIVDVVISGLVSSLMEDKKATLPNFGRFDIKVSKPRKARNPRTGEEVMVPEKRSVKFKAARELKVVAQSVE
jgi:nucleoid DNA-binding protein